MKYSILLAIALLACLSACDDDDSAPVKPKPPIIETRVVRDVDYIKNKFFLIDDPASFAGAFAYSVEVFVSVTPQDLIDDPALIKFPGWAIADSTMEGARIDAAVAEIGAGNTPAWALQQEFRRLARGSDFSLLMTEDSVVVGIELKHPMPYNEYRSLAVRYRSQLDAVIGGSLGTSPDTLFFEMIRAPDPRPTGAFGSTWRLAMRNAYDLGFPSIDPATLTVRIEDLLTTTRTDFSRPEGSDVPYVQIFGLDRYGATESDPPNGRIDNYYLNWSADIERGILWMPTGHGFAPPAERVDVWTGGVFEFSGPYLEQYERSSRIYNELLNAIDQQNVHQYIIEAAVTTPAP